MRTRFSALLALFAVAGLQACSPPAPAATGSPADEQAIRELAGKYAAAFGGRDTAALGALVSDDYETVEATGQHTQGRASFLAMMGQEFASMPAGMTLSMSATTTYVRWIDANHAIAGGTWETTPAMPPMPSKGSWMAVVAKEGDAWKMKSALGAADLSAMMPPPDTTKKKSQ